MSKTKFIKVSVEKRLPQEADYYTTDQGEAQFNIYDKKFWLEKEYEINPKYWLEEVPDREEEMSEAAKELLRFKNEMKSVMQEKLQYPDNFIKAVENLEQLLNN